MSDPTQKTIRAMQSASFYPHPVTSLELRETHISWVFLTGEFVYKIKKPVDLGFLDFTTLDKRAHYCRREVALNRRLTSDVYLDVLPITCGTDGIHLDGEGETIEFTVKMRQLASEDTLQRRLHDDAMDRSSIEQLAQRLVRFYHAAEHGPEIARFGKPDVIRRNCGENFRQIAAHGSAIVDRRLLDIIEAATWGFLENHHERFVERVRNGRIRDCHGDLRTDHVYLTGKGLQIIDCIEFNRRFRCGDVLADLAFLVMGMDLQGHSREAGILASAFARHAEDLHLFSLLDFYKCYRAMVRVKVDCMRLAQSDPDDDKRSLLHERVTGYLNLAYRYAIRFSRPVLWIVCGQVATGKSTLARALADSLNVKIIRSDLVRKRLFDPMDQGNHVVPFKEGIYSREATAMTYGQLLRQGQTELEKGRSVILDATFSTSEQRQEAYRLAETMGAAVLFIECRCREAVIRKRLRRRTDDDSTSDARIEHLDQLGKSFEPVDELADGDHVRVDTEHPLQESLQTIFDHPLRFRR